MKLNLTLAVNPSLSIVIFSNDPYSPPLCLLSGVYEPVFGFLGFHLEVVTLLIWNLINSAVFQSALTLT